MKIEDSNSEIESPIRLKLSKARRSFIRLTKKAATFTGWTVWMIGTAAVTLIGPVIFHYDKECHILDIQHQLLQAQQSSTAPVLN